MTSASEDPLETANEADVADQAQGVVEDGDGPPTPPDVSTDEANEADILEQGATVTDDDDAYPHEGEQADR